MTASAAATPPRVRRRKVFYIPGYDPFHPRRYRELYRRESADQAAVSGYEISQEAAGMGPYGWRVHSVQDGLATDSDVKVLLWSDIVKASMHDSIWETYAGMARTAWIYGTSGALYHMMRLRKGPVYSGFYPAGMLLVQLAVAILAAWGVGELAHMLVPRVLWGMALVWALRLGVFWVVLRWFKSIDNKLFAHYLMHDYGFSGRWRGANPPELRARLRDFQAEIAEAMTSGVDEVLVVGHSSGVHLAVTVLASLIREGQAKGTSLGFLSLGQAIPMVSFLPDADILRRDLNALSQSDALFWLDVNAPGDGCCFALCDPVGVSGVAPEQGQRWPVILSAAFTQTLSPERWAQLRWRFFRLHFQYLCAFDRPGDYDYFRITAGPLRLADRFAGRVSSSSVIRTARSPHRHMAP